MGDSSNPNSGLIEEISALKERIRELERSGKDVETHYHLLFERAPYGIVVIDPESARFVEFNETAHRQLGYSREEFAELSIPDIEVVETPEETLKHIERVIREGRDDFETRHRTRQGEIRNIHVTAQVTQISGRNVYHCVWRDITDHKQAEEEFVISRNRLSRAEIISRCGNWEFHLERNTVFASEGARRIYGLLDRVWTIEEVQKIPLPEYRPMLNDSLLGLIRENLPYNVEFKIRRPDTGEIVDIHSVAEYDRLRNVVFGVIQDITDRKRAEEALFESEAKYRTLVENSLAGVYIYQDGLFRFVNRQFCEILGYGYDEIVDKLGPLDVAHPEDRYVIEELTGKFSAGGVEDISLTHRAVRKDGATITIKVSGSPTTYRGRPAGSGTIYDITQQEETEEQLRQKTALLEAQLNASLDGIIVVDKGRKIFQNRLFSKLFSIPDHIAESEDDAPQVEWVTGLTKNPEQFSREVSYMFAHPGEILNDELELKDGTVLERYSGPVIGRDGKDYGRIWTVRDITGRKRSEETLRASRIQLSEAMDLAHIVYWELDPVTLTFTFNDPFYALYGTTAAREGGYVMARDEYAKRFIHPDDLERYYRFVEENTLRQDPKSVVIEHRIVRRDGEVRHVLARSRIVKDDSGRIVKRYGAIQDITERRQMEKTIEEGEEQFRKMFEGSPLGMVMTGMDLRFMRANDAFCGMMGYTEEELVSLTFKDITHPEHLAEDALHVGELVAGKIPLYRTEKRYMRKDGEIIWGASTVSLMRDRDGRFLYSLTTVEDITQRRQAEEERARLESQLRQAQKMEAVGTLAGGVAHDFNNILTVIAGYGTLLKMEMGQNNPLQSHVEPILSSAEKAAHLTRSLLSFSRQQPIVLTHIDLNENLRSVEKLLKRLLTENISISTSFSGEQITIMADATQIDRILFNLATNARDAMPQGGTFTIETRTVELDRDFVRIHGYGEPGPYALLSVSDTGVGMDETTRERIFDPFFTTKEAGKGTGLGLSSVYGTVKQHNGLIVVYSEPGIGTTFRIYFPAVNKVDKEEKPAPAPVRGGHETILIAEDSDAVRGLIRKILVEYGYTVIEAIDGSDAVEQFKKADKIDLLIFDSVMPKKNGREAFHEIHRIRPDMKVIFTSGYTRDAFLDKDIEEEKFDFLQKPISPNVLLQRVREVLDGPESGSP